MRAVQKVFFCMVALWLSWSVQAAVLTDLQFASLPGDIIEMKFVFADQVPETTSYTIEQPARIALDLLDTNSQLQNKYHRIGDGNARSVTVVEANNRARVIVNLNELVPYSSRIEGNQLVVLVGAQTNVAAEPATGAATTAPQAAVTAPSERASPSTAPSAEPSSPAGYARPTVTDIDFRRGLQGEGQVIITLSNSNIAMDMVEEGNRIRLDFPTVELPEKLQRRLDVTDFATPVQFIDAYVEAGGGVLIIEPQGEYDYLAYQADNRLTVNVKPLTTDEAQKRKKEKFPYTGEKLTLNFQDIEVRAVLQLIADFTGLNLVASDTVTGKITLRLKKVPWDQALDLVLKTKGLGKRQVGNVLLVAPAAEIAARERQELEANKQVKELAPLRTEYVQVRYAKAKDILDLLASDQGLISERGAASVDERTNTLIIQDTSESLDNIRSAMTVLDIPVRQVLIEARIVIARTNLGEQLGIRWGGAYYDNNDGKYNLAGGSLTTISEGSQTLNDIAENERRIARGEDPEDVELPSTPDNLVVDLGLADPSATSFAIGVAALDHLLELELTALETDGQAEIVSQPKVITSDGQTAKIESGTEIPFQRATSSGATSVEFKSATLLLEVTPQITPDDRIIMDLEVSQDSVGQLTSAGPSIDTNSVETQVLVENGETIVLGGIFRTEEIKQVTKTPFLGDLPYVGRLFKRTEFSEQKSELLVFITPRLVKDSLAIR